MAKYTGTRCRSIDGLGLAMSLGLLFTGAVGCGDAATITDPEPDGIPPGVIKQPPATPSTGAPPPISGGSLLVTQDDTTVVAADPDRDVVWLVDTAKRELRARVTLDKGAEPGRIIEDQDHNVHVALRRGGDIVKIDPRTGSIVSQRKVCAAPRGMAYDKPTDNLYVVCAGGELVTLKARGGAPIHGALVESDLRDVVIKGDHLLISRFRSAEVVETDRNGAIINHIQPRTVANNDPMVGSAQATPTVAWRMAALPNGDALMLHQRGRTGPVSTKPGGYGGGRNCKGGRLVSSALTVLSRGNNELSKVGAGGEFMLGTMIVDVAVSRDGQKLAMISPSSTLPNANVPSPRTDFEIVNLGDLTPSDPCMFPGATAGTITSRSEPIAGAYDGWGQLWVQSRNPAQLLLMAANGGATATIVLPDAEDRADEGHRLFHTATAAGIACASCHPEAGDDAHVWTFDTLGPRRTPVLRGGLLATAPFHWDGDMTDLSKLMKEVFTGRMTGPVVSPSQIDAVGKWMDAQPALPHSPAKDMAAVVRGKELFQSPAVGCASCHSGKNFTNNQTVDVGTGKSFQVPSLVDLASRAPYMHTGCAYRLSERFASDCGGTAHGNTAALTSSQLSDLVAYLETL